LKRIQSRLWGYTEKIPRRFVASDEMTSISGFDASNYQWLFPSYTACSASAGNGGSVLPLR
jgi:hypothetical protein